MSKNSTKATAKRVFEMALAFGLGSVFVVPAVMYIRSKMGV
jgi:hypothetical protein